MRNVIFCRYLKNQIQQFIFDLNLKINIDLHLKLKLWYATMLKKYSVSRLPSRVISMSYSRDFDYLGIFKTSDWLQNTDSEILQDE